MKLYFILGENRYVHRQSDIPKGAETRVDDIPTDLAGLMAHLNELHQRVSEPEVAPEVPEALIEPVRAPQPNLAQRALARCDVEEIIQNAEADDLASYAHNVCWRMQELMKKI